MSELKELQEATDLINRLPDTYTKQPMSNLFRLFRIVGAELAELRAALQTTERYRDIDQAAGATLDRIGWGNLRIPRDGATDITYSLRIKAQIIQYKADGTIDALIEGLAFALDCRPDAIGVDPGYMILEQPASLLITAPHAVLLESALSGAEIQDLVEGMAAAGVSSEMIFSLHSAFLRAIPERVTGKCLYPRTGFLYARPRVASSTCGFTRRSVCALDSRPIVGVSTSWLRCGAYYCGEDVA